MLSLKSPWEFLNQRHLEASDFSLPDPDYTALKLDDVANTAHHAHQIRHKLERQNLTLDNKVGQKS